MFGPFSHNTGMGQMERIGDFGFRMWDVIECGVRSAEWGIVGGFANRPYRPMFLHFQQGPSLIEGHVHVVDRGAGFLNFAVRQGAGVQRAEADLLD